MSSAVAPRRRRAGWNHDGKLDKAEKAEAAKAGNAKSSGKAAPASKENSP
jgi:hypothetical protein